MTTNNNNNNNNNIDTNIISFRDFKPYTAQNWVNDELSDGATFEELLELFDLTPAEVFEHLLTVGLIDQERFAEYLSSDH